MSNIIDICTLLNDRKASEKEGKINKAIANHYMRMVDMFVSELAQEHHAVTESRNLLHSRDPLADLFGVNHD